MSYRDYPKYILAKQVTHRVATKHVSYRDALIQIKQGERANAAITETSISVVDADSEQQQHQTGEAQSKIGNKSQITSLTMRLKSSWLVQVFNVT